jgi:hypothetical protein
MSILVVRHGLPARPDRRRSHRKAWERARLCHMDVAAGREVQPSRRNTARVEALDFVFLNESPRTWVVGQCVENASCIFYHLPLGLF